MMMVMMMSVYECVYVCVPVYTIHMHEHWEFNCCDQFILMNYHMSSNIQNHNLMGASDEPLHEQRIAWALFAGLLSSLHFHIGL